MSHGLFRSSALVLAATLTVASPPKAVAAGVFGQLARVMNPAHGCL